LATQQFLRRDSRGASRMLGGLMLRWRAVLGTPKCEKICWSPGLRPGPRWGSLQRSPRLASWWGGGFAAPLPKNPTYNIVIVFVLAVYTYTYIHTCMKMHCYFLLNVKRGASQLYLGGPPTI